MADWSLFSRDESYRITGGLPISSAQAVRRHLGVSTAVVETPYSEAAYARTAPGGGIVLYRDGVQQFSGLVGSERTMGWDATNGVATIKVACVGDEQHLADRLSYPDPARAGHEQTTADRWTYTGPASSAMWALINTNAGPAARPERRVPALYMGDDPGSGAVRTWAALFQDVMYACQVFSALAGTNPGLRVTTTPDGLRVDVYEPRQLADNIRFSADLTNLHGFTYTEQPPTVTYALVAGQGNMADRIRRSATSTSPDDLRWGRRIERYLDRRDEENPDELQIAADDELAEGVGQVNLTVALSDSEAATYGRDWDLGDRITVYVGLPGQASAATVADVVREVLLEVDASGAETIRPAIGGTDAKAILPTPSQQVLARIGRTLTGLITRK